MKTLDDIAKRLDILIELLATMHPYKPEINFSPDGHGYDIRWHNLDETWPVHGNMAEVEELVNSVSDTFPWGVTMQIHPDGHKFYTK